VQTIRYYEEIGLMPHAARTAGNQLEEPSGTVARTNDRPVPRLPDRRLPGVEALAGAADQHLPRAVV
jgi:hypothetical protein